MPKKNSVAELISVKIVAKYPSVSLLREDSVDPPFLSHARAPMGTALALESLGGNSVK